MTGPSRWAPVSPARKTASSFIFRITTFLTTYIKEMSVSIPVSLHSKYSTSSRNQSKRLKTYQETMQTSESSASFSLTPTIIILFPQLMARCNYDAIKIQCFPGVLGKHSEYKRTSKRWTKPHQTVQRKNIINGKHCRRRMEIKMSLLTIAKTYMQIKVSIYNFLQVSKAAVNSEAKFGMTQRVLVTSYTWSCVTLYQDFRCRKKPTNRFLLLSMSALRERVVTLVKLFLYFFPWAKQNLFSTSTCAAQHSTICTVLWN